MAKQILAGLEISDHEIRLIVGEFFNTRLNILKVEKVDCDALNQNGVINQETLIKAIKEAKENVEKNLALPLQKVLLSIPSVDVKRVAVQEKVTLNSVNKQVTYKDIRRAIANGQKRVKSASDSIIVQTNCYKFIANGIASRRCPIDETLDELIIQMDIYLANKKWVFDLVSAVEGAGLSVIQLFLDSFAIAKEASLFEQSIDKYLIVLDGDYYSTKLSLLSGGRLVNFMVLPLGLQSFVDALDNQYHIGFKQSARLVKYNVRLDADKLSNQTCYVWAENDTTKTLNEKLIYDSIIQPVDDWIDMVNSAVKPILDAGKAMIVVCDELSEIIGLTDYMHEKINCEIKTYTPETLGIRSSSLTSCAGLLYAYKDYAEIIGVNDNSVDVEAFAQHVDIRSGNAKEMTITNKLRNVLLQGKK